MRPVAAGNMGPTVRTYSAIKSICNILTSLVNDLRAGTEKYDSFKPSGIYKNGHLAVLSVRKTVTTPIPMILKNITRF